VLKVALKIHGKKKRHSTLPVLFWERYDQLKDVSKGKHGYFKDAHIL